MEKTEEEQRRERREKRRKQKKRHLLCESPGINQVDGLPPM